MAKQKRRATPKKLPEGVVRGEQIHVVVSDTEKTKLAAAAARDHLPVSVWLRQLGLKAADAQVV